MDDFILQTPSRKLSIVIIGREFEVGQMASKLIKGLELGTKVELKIIPTIERTHLPNRERIDIAIVCNIKLPDNADLIQIEAKKEDYYDFLCSTKELIIANLTDPIVAEVVKNVMKKTCVAGIDYTRSEFNLSVRGKQNRFNTSAVFQLGLALGLEADKIKQVLENE